LAAWVGQGQVVVRIVVGDEPAEDLVAAEQLGLTAGPLPIASLMAALGGRSIWEWRPCSVGR
jgi:hypothetical protein